MPNAAVNGTELYYEVHGEGEPVLFLHGVGGNHAIWWQQVPYFAQRYQVITLDQRGFGRSKEIPEGPHRKDYMDDVLGLLDHLGIQKTYLVAQSMGGTATIAMVARHPERVKAAVMSDTVGNMNDPGIEAMQAENRGPAEKLSQPDRALSKGFQQREPVLTELFLQINSFNKANRHNVRSEGYKGPTPEEVAKSGVPVMFIIGQEDVVATPNTLRRAHKLCTGSKAVEVPGAGHSVYWERPDLYNFLVDEFLQSAGN